MISSRKLLIFYSITFFFFAQTFRAQELKADVVVSAPGITTVNKNVFKTLERSITEFLNTTRWTNKVFKPEEKIKANFYIVVKEYKNNRFVCDLNVSGIRPVYNSSYETNTITVSDKNFTFTYLEYQPISFNAEMLDNNLTAVLAFYVYMIIGYDFDSFKLNAGRPYFEKAKSIQATAAGQGFAGWENQGKFFSRAEWVDQLLLASNIMFHKAFYTYHRLGLDKMADDPMEGKTNIIRSLQYLETVNNKNADILIKLFFDTKSDELVRILSGGPDTVNQNLVYEILMNLAPMYRMKWDNLNLK